MSRRKKLTRREIGLVSAARRLQMQVDAQFHDNHRVIVRVRGMIVYDATIEAARSRAILAGDESAHRDTTLVEIA